MESNSARWELRTPRRPAAAALALMLCVACGVSALGAPPESTGERIEFSKSFPGSIPAYFEISVDAGGNASYREDPDDEDPLRFQLSEDETRGVFELAEKLDRFQGNLQTDRKVAFTGTKTLRYRSAAGEQTETQFTYSTDKNAQAIVEWFESAGETERHLIALDRVVQFDRLGVNKALLQFQVSFDDGRIVAARQFLPILKTIAEESKIMHIARSRAASLVQRIEGGVSGDSSTSP